MELKDVNENYIFKTRIDLKNLDGEGDDYIVLRELNMQEMNGFDKRDGDESLNKNLKYLEGIFKDCLVDHSFTKEGEPASKVEVYNELKKTSSLFMEILATWLGSLPLSTRLKKENLEQ
ncbi:transposase [Treponema sp. OMZ 799]|uniref:transposase n=1 Tax=Treponema sp. OMZ 799 TaxID=2563668 RepID=UPI0020A619D7|nr:transposase [Treponema sp. OMZ 799]UTC78110.1 transposase [Treponema sp. OMZ 799]